MALHHSCLSLMDLFEDNEGLYKTGEKAYSNRESLTRGFASDQSRIPGKDW